MPSHAYMRAIYSYPQHAFPYDDLIATNGRRTKHDPEYELIDTGIFDGDRYFDVLIEYAKAAPDDILIKITATNRGPEAALLHLLPTFWFRNTWSWDPDAPRPRDERRRGRPHRVAAPVDGGADARLLRTGRRPALHRERDELRAPLRRDRTVRRSSRTRSTTTWSSIAQTRSTPENSGRRRPRTRPSPWRPARPRHAAAPVRQRRPRGPVRRGLRRRSSRRATRSARTSTHALMPFELTPDERLVQRRALAGLLWSKQFYHYIVRTWLQGDPATPPPPASRLSGRNCDWEHALRRRRPLDARYVGVSRGSPPGTSRSTSSPWPMIDPDFAKSQLLLLTREWYMHPNGQLPAYEWAFGDVNPPVHAWAALSHLSQIEQTHVGTPFDLVPRARSSRSCC